MRLILEPRSHKSFSNFCVPMVQGLWRGSGSYFFFNIALVMKALHLWINSMVLPSTRYFLDINVFIRLTYCKISWMSFSNGILIERLLSLVRSFFNLTFPYFFLILWGKGEGIFIWDNRSHFISSPSTTLGVPSSSTISSFIIGSFYPLFETLDPYH